MHQITLHKFYTSYIYKKKIYIIVKSIHFLLRSEFNILFIYIIVVYPTRNKNIFFIISNFNINLLKLYLLFYNSECIVLPINEFCIVYVIFIYRCLEDNNWNYEKSSLCFIKLKSRIPSTAYIHNLD